jgi:hypothetical protein
MMLSSKFSSTLGTSHAQTSDYHNSALKSTGGGHSALRPDLNSKQRIRLEISQADDASGDEVPLNSIRVQRDMTWQETVYDSPRQDA